MFTKELPMLSSFHAGKYVESRPKAICFSIDFNLIHAAAVFEKLVHVNLYRVIPLLTVTPKNEAKQRRVGHSLCRECS